MTMQPEPQPTEPRPAAKSPKPRLLQDGRDMFWSIVPLVVACIVLAGLAGTCTFTPGTTTRQTVPPYDVAAALRADAQTFGFPVRLPRLPEGWQPSSGSRGGIENGRTDPSNAQRLRAVTSTVGYLSPTGMYLSLTQSNADEDDLRPELFQPGRLHCRFRQAAFGDGLGTGKLESGGRGGFQDDGRAGVDHPAGQSGRSRADRHHRCRERRSVPYAGGGHSIAATVAGQQVEVRVQTG